MHNFLALDESTRAAAIKETAARMGLHPTPVEKDFWVCFLLRELFALDCVQEHLIFKGGTSLSKAYGIIERFSEDIDLSVHSSAFDIDLHSGFGALERSEQRVRMTQLYKAAGTFIDQKFTPELRQRLEERLPEKNWRLQAHRRSEDFNIILFHYPKVIKGEAQPHYTTPYVQIEVGVRAQHEPAANKEVQPYIAEQFPQVFEQPATPVKVLSARRTFWEKATIYHAELSNPADQPMRKRYARHAYDLHQLLLSDEGKEALGDHDLLQKVSEHKAHFHASKHVDYAAAHTGGLKVMPEGPRTQELADDYAAMRDFFMSEPPPFDDILASLQTIEQQANQLTS